MINGNAGQLGQFERDVFDDMAEIGALAQSLSEASLALHTTVMFRKPRQQIQQKFVEPRKFTTLSPREFIKIKPH